MGRQVVNIINLLSKCMVLITYDLDVRHSDRDGSSTWTTMAASQSRHIFTIKGMWQGEVDPNYR